MSEAALQDAACAKHPDRRAAGVCSRCGAFACIEDLKLLDHKPYCAECAARPDVNWLEAFRLKYWGRRDGWAWVFGFGAVLNILAGISSIEAREWLLLGLSVVSAAVGIGFFFGKKWARIAMVGVPVAGVFVLAAFMGGTSALATMLVPVFFSIAIFLDTRNKLFFRVDVPAVELRRLWDRLANNQMARTGLQLGFLGLLIPFVAPFGLVCSIVGLRRVDPNATPPVGRKKSAIAGIVLGSIGCLELAAMLSVLVRGR